MISEKSVTVYGFVSIGIMVVILALVWFKLVPDPLYLPLFFVALAAFLARIILRIVSTRRQHSDGGDENLN